MHRSLANVGKGNSFITLVGFLLFAVQRNFSVICARIRQGLEYFDRKWPEFVPCWTGWTRQNALFKTTDSEWFCGPHHEEVMMFISHWDRSRSPADEFLAATPKEQEKLVTQSMKEHWDFYHFCFLQHLKYDFPQ